MVRRNFGQELVLHPPGAGQAYASGRGNEEDEAYLPGIVIKLRAKCIDVLDIGEGRLSWRKSRPRRQINIQKYNCEDNCQGEQAAPG